MGAHGREGGITVIKRDGLVMLACQVVSPRVFCRGGKKGGEGKVDLFGGSVAGREYNSSASSGSFFCWDHPHGRRGLKAEKIGDGRDKGIFRSFFQLQ